MKLQALFVVAGLGLSIAQAAYAQPMDLYGQCLGTSRDASPERAIKACSAILLMPDLRSERRPDFLERRASLYLLTGQHDKAVADYSKAIDLSRDNAHLYNARCWARAVAGQQLDLGLADCDASLKLRPNDAAALDSRGFIKFRKGDYSASIADFDAALALAPKRAASLYVRGLAKQKLGDTAGSDADVAAADAIDPKVADVYASYGITP